MLWSETRFVTCGIGEAREEAEEAGVVGQQPGRGRVGHIAGAGSEAGIFPTPHTQEVPYVRVKYITNIYENISILVQLLYYYYTFSGPTDDLFRHWVLQSVWYLPLHSLCILSIYPLLLFLFLSTLSLSPLSFYSLPLFLFLSIPSPSLPLSF